MTLLYVINTPTVYNRLRAELDAAAAAGAPSSPLKDAEAKRHPYLQAMLREGLRVFPGAASFFFKQVPIGGDTICGHYLPAGTQVGTNVLGILRSKKYWGEDADVFRPERWLGVSEARLEEMNFIFEVQFGFGRYKCLGRPLAFLELTKTLPELLRRFDFAVVNPPPPVKITNAGFFAMEGMWLRVTKRQHT
ncbi:benzoate 4-monooxygenase cytochrome P450 [Thozetella sp. PMI_491]|nr:benzoate 4-monooxygenase cytochrome P450 [Thozetella sp. PMI_491]